MKNKISNGCPVPNGVLIVIGGKENKGEKDGKKENVIELEIMKYFVEVTKKKNPKIEIITTASGEPEESFNDYKKLFHQLKVKQIGHIHHNGRKEAMTDDLRERINKADACYFTGGDQLRLTATYGGTPLLTHLKERYIHNSLVIGGTSAGAMALSTPMIYAGTGEKEKIAGEIKITTGMEFLKDVCIDTHFVHRGRFVRMAQVIVTNPTCIGMGIEEDTALIVRKGLEAEIVGSGVVIVIDGFHIEESNVLEFAEKDAISMRNLRVHILSRGDRYFIPQCNPPHI